MAKKKIRAPITLKVGDEYVNAGTEVELEAAEADAIIARHGEYQFATFNDPGNTVELMNEITSHTEKREGDLTSDEQVDDLSKMTKAELEAEAEKRGIVVPSGATKAEIIELLNG